MRMMSIGFRFLFTLSFLWGARPLFAQDAVSAPPAAAEDLYHQALASYLDGNYDQAILLSARSLEKDPTFQKSKNLLSILASEKELEGKTVIWLAGKPSLIPATPTTTSGGTLDGTGLGLEVHALEARMGRFQDSQMKKYAEMSGQIQVIQELVKNNSENQYSELKGSQVEIYNQLRDVRAGRGQDLWILYLLCFASMVISFAAIWRKPRK